MTTAIGTLPRLENGDNLTREEFHRFYTLRPDIKKAELIDGVVYVPSPTRAPEHGKPHGVVMTWLGVYCVHRPSTDFADNTTLIILNDSEVQPDGVLYYLPPRGKGLRQIDDGYLST